MPPPLSRILLLPPEPKEVALAEAPEEHRLGGPGLRLGKTQVRTCHGNGTAD
jgi:hypothetical protein